MRARAVLTLHVGALRAMFDGADHQSEQMSQAPMGGLRRLILRVLLVPVRWGSKRHMGVVVT